MKTKLFPIINTGGNKVSKGFNINQNNYLLPAANGITIALCGMMPIVLRIAPPHATFGLLTCCLYW